MNWKIPPPIARVLEAAAVALAQNAAAKVVTVISEHMAKRKKAGEGQGGDATAQGGDRPTGGSTPSDHPEGETS